MLGTLVEPSPGGGWGVWTPGYPLSSSPMAQQIQGHQHGACAPWSDPWCSCAKVATWRICAMVGILRRICAMLCLMAHLHAGASPPAQAPALVEWHTCASFGTGGLIGTIPKGRWRSCATLVENEACKPCSGPCEQKVLPMDVNMQGA